MKKLAVPFVQQPNNFTCGPACLDMLFRFFETRVAFSRIVTLSQTGARRGTPRRGMIRSARTLGFHVHAQNDMTWADLVAFIAEGRPILVNNRDITDKQPHYVVVVGIDAHEALVHDPYGSKNMRISRRVFEDHWYGSFHKKYTHWGMVIWPKDGQRS